MSEEQKRAAIKLTLKENGYEEGYLLFKLIRIRRSNDFSKEEIEKAGQKPRSFKVLLI